MKKVKEDEKGITLIVLAITILLIIILSSVAIYSGASTIRSSKLTAFTAEMKLMQGKVNELYQKHKIGEKVNGKDVLSIGKDIDVDDSVTQKTFSPIENGGSGIIDSVGYRYYDRDTLRELGLEDVKGEFFVNIQTRNIISYEGFKENENIYYTLSQLPKGLYNVEYEVLPENLKPDFGTTENVDISFVDIDSRKTKISVVDRTYNKYIDKWQVEYYRKEDFEEPADIKWNTSEELSFIVNKSGTYVVQIFNGNIHSEPIEVEIPVKALPKIDGKTIPYLPKNGKFVRDERTDLESGLVIRDNEGRGNSYVWIEVPQTIYKDQTLNGGVAEILENDYAGIERTLRNYAKDYIDNNYSDTWVANSAVANEATYNELKNKMLSSIFLNGGFWISQYEVGIGQVEGKEIDITGPIEDDSKLPTPVSREGAYPYRYVNCNQAQFLAQKLYDYEYDEHKSSLLFGIQWDLVLKYLEEKGRFAYGSKIKKYEIKEDSTSWGNYRNAEIKPRRGKYMERSQNVWNKCDTETIKKIGNQYLFTTGVTERNMVANIYDLTGNVLEWTLEKSSDDNNPWTYRGGDLGSYGSDVTVEKRNNAGNGNHKWDCIGFRATIF